jgi:hypothetical protein
MDGKLKVLALIGAVLVAAAWTRAELQTGSTAASPRLISVALSTPPYNPLPGTSHLPVANPPVANPYAAIHNTSATNLWAGTAWSEYFSEPYHYQCGGKTAWQMRGAGGVGAGGDGAGGCDAGGCDSCGASSSCHCFDRFLQNLTLFQRRCTACDDVASCDTCDTCDSCSAAGGDQWDTGHEEPPQPELDQDMQDMQLDPMPEPMSDPVLEPMDPPMPKPMPKQPAPVTPPRNPLPQSTSRPPRLILRSTPASYQASPQRPPRLVLQSRQFAQQPPRLVLEPRQLVQPPQRLVLEPPQQTKTRQIETPQRQVQPTRLTQPGQAMLRFRTTTTSVARSQQAGLSLNLLLSAEQR